MNSIVSTFLLVCVPVDRRDVDILPVFEIVAKAFGVAAFLGIVHLFVDGLFKLAEHSGPVGVLVKLRKTLGELGDLLQRWISPWIIASRFGRCTFTATSSPE